MHPRHPTKSCLAIALSLFAAFASGCDDEEGTVVRTDAGVAVDASASSSDSGTRDGASGDASAITDGGADTATPFTATHTLTILHTNDLHSHLMGHGPELDYTPATPRDPDDQTLGGFARLATALATQRMDAQAAKRDVLTLDGGDFMMGTLFEFLATANASELKLMKALGYDATVIGNHELDWTPDGLAAILGVLLRDKVDLPVLATNLKFSATSAVDDNLEKVAAAGGLRTKLVKELPNGLKVGFFGLLGKDAASVTPTAAPLTFEDIVVASKAAVADLRQNDKVDLVIALSHAGITAAGTGEDRVLAEQVDGLDVIVSGHTHEELAQPVVVTHPSGRRTVVVTAGRYGERLGRLDLDIQKGAGGVQISVHDYKLIRIDDSITGSGAVQGEIDKLIIAIDGIKAFADAGLAYRKTVGSTEGNLEKVAFGESPLGNLVTDSYRTIAAALSPGDPPVIAVEANGSLRDPLRKGKTGAIWVADLFRVLPLGIGPNRLPGYPLVAFYLNGKDLRAGMELMAASSSPLIANDDYFLQVSGLEVEYKPTNVLFGRVTSLKLAGAGGTKTTIDPADTTTCYKVVTSYYVASLLGLVKQVTGGAFAVTAKQKDCATPVTDLTTALVDANPLEPGVQELKAYQALFGYVSRLPAAMIGPPIPAIPAAYLAPQGRIKKVTTP